MTWRDRTQADQEPVIKTLSRRLITMRRRIKLHIQTGRHKLARKGVFRARVLLDALAALGWEMPHCAREVTELAKQAQDATLPGGGS